MVPDYEQRLDDLFNEAFEKGHPALGDWILIKYELKGLRDLVTEHE